MTIVRELTDREIELINKHQRRAQEGLRMIRLAEESLNDLQEVLCGEEERLDPDQMAIVEVEEPEDSEDE